LTGTSGGECPDHLVGTPGEETMEFEQIFHHLVHFTKDGNSESLILQGETGL
jgi:hypothetical protein